MKFIYFYSKIYEFYHNHLQNNLSQYFDLESILIDDLKPQKGHTFLGGLSIKIELIIKKIQENINKYIVFTDATIFVNNKNANYLNKYFESYFENDICFADNQIDETKTPYNIGIILIKCNNNTINFFQSVLTQLKNEKKKNQFAWDQKVVNDLLKNNLNIKVSKFDKRIYCNYKIEKSYLDSFFIFKSYIKHTNNIIKNYNQRIQTFYNCNLINNEEYVKLLK